mgnify:CR=1 FL=1
MATRSLGTLTIDVLARTANLTQGMSKAAREVDNEAKRIRRSLESNVAQGANTASDALNRFGAQVVSIAAAWRGLSAGIAAADTWTNLNNRLRLVTDGQDQFVAAQENVLRIAKETRQPLEATAELYQRIATNQKELGLSGQGVADIVETISKAMVVSGTSAQGAQAALVQLGQAFASGTLRGEELNSVLEQAPALANAIAAGLGVPIGKLRELGKAGELTAEQVIGALQDQADEIDAAFGKMDTTIGQALTNVRTNLTEIIGRFSEATGAASGLASAINFLGNNLPQVAAAFAAFASVKLTQQLVDRVRAFRETQAALVAQTKAELANAQAIELKTRAALLDAQAEVRRAQAIGGSVAVSAQAAQATLAHRQAVIALEAAQARAAAAANVWGRAAGSLLGFFGGPAGLAVMLATTAASWLLFRDNTDKASQALIDFSGAADTAIEKFRELNRQQQAGEILRLQEEMSDNFGDIALRVSQVSNLISGLGVNADLPGFIDRVEDLKDAFHAGRISADEFSQAIDDAAREAVKGVSISEGLERALVDQTAALGTLARDYERQRKLLDEFTGAQRGAEASVDSNTKAIRDQAAALAQGQKALSDYIGKMDQMINQGVVSLVRKTKGEFAALQVEVGQLINAAGGVDALDPQQRAAINKFLEIRRRQIQLEQEYDAQRKAARGGRGRKSDAEREAEQLQRSYESMMESMRERIALFGQEGEAARVRYEIEHGSLKALDDAKKQALLTEAERLDTMRRLAEQQEAADRAVREDYERIQEGLKYGKELLADLQFELELMRMTNAERATAIQLRGMEAEAVAEYGEAIARANRDIEESMKQMRLMDDMRNEFSNFFEDIISGTESVSDAFKNLLNGIANAITRFVSQRLVEQLFGQFGTMGGGSTGWISSIAGIFAGRRASGGWVGANSLAEVNERGFEMATVNGRDYLLTGNRPVEITPNHMLGFGGASVTNNFAFAAPTSPKTQSQIAARVGYEIRRAQRLGV